MDKLRLEILMAAVDKVTGPLKAVAQGSRSTASAIGKTQQALKGLEAQQRALARFEQQVAALDAARQQLDQAKAVGANRAAVGQLTTEYEKQLGVVKKLQRDMAARGWADSTVDQHQLAAGIAATNAQLDAQNAKLRRQQDIERRLHTLREQHSAAMVKMAAWGGTFAGMKMVGGRMMRTGLAPVDAYMSHEDAMMGVQRQVNGARWVDGKPTKVYREVESQVRALSERIPQTTVQIAEMFSAAARMEVPTDELATFVELNSEIATAFDAVPDEIAESMGKIANNLKIPVTDIRGLADTINYLDDNAISKGSDIIGFLNRVGGVAGTVGITGKNMAALGSTLLTSGETEETAGTGIKAIFTNLAAATKGPARFQRGVRDIGMTPEQIQEGMSKDAVDMLMQVAEAINKLPKKNQLGVMADLAGKEHVGRLAKLVTNTEELRRQIKLANSAEAEGSMAREAQARNSALSAQMVMLKNRIFNLNAIAGEPLKAAIMDVLKVVNPLLTRLSEWMQKNPAMVGGMLKAVIVLGALAGAMGTLGIAVITVLGPMHLARYLLARTMLNMAAARLAALGAAPALGMMARAWAWMGRTVGVAGPWLLRAAQWLGAWMATASTYLPVLGRLVIVALRMLGPFGLLITAAVMLYQRWEDVKGGFRMLMQDMGAAAMAGLQSIASLATRAFDAGASIVLGIANGISSRIQAVRDSISTAAGAAVDWFKEKLGIRSPSRVFMELGGFVSEGAAKGIQNRAGLVRSATVAMAAGGMLAMSPVASAAGVGGGALAGSIGGATYNITINAAPGMDAQAIARAVSAELDRRERDRSSGRLSMMADMD